MERARKLLAADVHRPGQTAPQTPPNPPQPQQPPLVLQNPLPTQGVVNTQPLAPPQANAPTQQLITYTAPDQPMLDSGTHHLLMMSSDEINLQTRRNQYGSTPEAPPADTPTNAHPTDQALRIPPPPLDGAPRVPRFPLHRINSNPNARAVSNYNIVDDLAQSPAAMSALEVLKNYPS